MNREEIIEKVKQAGIVGAGGGGFPTHVKIRAQVETLIANGSECEPILSTDKYLMENRAEEIVRGLRYAKQTTGAKNVCIAVKKNYERALKEFYKILGESSDIEIHLLENYYPAGDEFDLVYNLTGKIIPEGSLPVDVGCVVVNVNTLLHICTAVERDEPVTTRWVTVAGEVEEPYIAEVPTGISAGELVDFAGPVKSNYRLLAGGPMMGELVEDSYRITRLTGGILVFPEDHPVIIKQGMSLRAHKRRAKSICDQCFDCTILCPRNLIGHKLEPHKVMRQVFIDPQYAYDYTPAFLCSQCGLCNMYACPLDLSPKNLLKEVKDKLQKAGIQNPHRNGELKPHTEKEFRNVSLERLAVRIGVDKYEKKELKVKKVDTDRVAIALCQHIGSPAQPKVKKGDRVRKGEVIGIIEGDSLGAMVHASIDGIVEKVTDDRIEISRTG